MAGHSYRIGEFAALAGIPAKTLRFYDETGLLQPAAIDARTRYRYYHSQQLHVLASIRALKELGLSLSEIRTAMARSDARHSRKVLLEQLRERVQRSIHAGQQTLAWIDEAMQELNGAGRTIPVVVKRRAAVRIASVRSVVRS